MTLDKKCATANYEYNNTGTACGGIITDRDRTRTQTAEIKHLAGREELIAMASAEIVRVYREDLRQQAFSATQV